MDSVGDRPGSGFAIWREALEKVHAWFERQRAGQPLMFDVKAYGVFFAINLVCFWWALMTAYPHYIVSQAKLVEYSLMSVPVALMGAMFDIVSLRVTLWAVDRALKSKRQTTYLAFLSIDLLIAMLATLWVVFAFVVSGWLVASVLPIQETLSDRAALYQERAWVAFFNPFAAESLRTIYFGVVMGASALIPTIIHVALAVMAFSRSAMQAVSSRSAA